MMDTRTADQRSFIMRSVRSADTGPELLVRRLLHRMGYRYRLHRRDLPGKPDIVFSSRQTVIFVHGCFWHGHGCGKGQLPKSKTDYWGPKIARNQQRDAEAEKELASLGWKVVTLWQCELGDEEALKHRLKAALEAS